MTSNSRIDQGGPPDQVNETDKYRSEKGKQRMSDLQKVAQEKSVLRWGGLAGMVGGIIFILVFVIVGVFAGMESVDVMRFPDVKTALKVGDSLYLVVLILWVFHFLALYRALRETSLTPALFGSVLGILGLVVLAVDSLHGPWQTRISDLYHAPGTTLEAQATLVLLWQTTQGIFSAFLVTGLLFLPIGVIALGVAMFKAPAFGKGFGGLSVVLGVVGVVAASVLLLVDPRSLVAVVGVFALIVFHLVLGWKVYRLSRAA
jgi:magnesium-transporting ATPase (P-type)